MRPGKREMPELMLQPFDEGLLCMFDSSAALASSVAALDGQGVVYGSTDSKALLTTGHALSPQQRLEQLPQTVFSASLRLAIGLEDRIDPAKYVVQTIQPIIDKQRSGAYSHVANAARQQRLESGAKSVNGSQVGEAQAALRNDEQTEHEDMFESIPAAVLRAKAVGVEAEAVVSSFKSEAATDPEKQFALVRVLSSDFDTIDGRGFQDPALALATFFGIADRDPDANGSRTGAELTALLRDGYFDGFIARETLSEALEKQADGDRLTEDEIELCKMIRFGHFLTGEDADTIIDRLSTPDGIEQWFGESPDLLAARRKWYEQTIAANEKRIRSLIDENYLAASPIDRDEFARIVNRAYGIQRTFSQGSSIGEAVRLGRQAELAQDEKRRRLLGRLIGEQAVATANAETVVERPIRFLHANGDRNYHPDDNAGHILDDYLGLYDGDPLLAEDLQISIDYLKKLPPQDMAILLSRGNGLRTLSGQNVVVDGKKAPLLRMKPGRIPGLPTKSRETNYMRILFVQLKGDQGLGIIDVVRRDRLDRSLAKKY